MKGKIFVICGKSASGKDTLVKKILSTGGTNTTIGLLPSITTRPKRPGEKDEYMFVNNETFDKMVAQGKVTCVYEADTENGLWKYGKLPPSDTLYDDVVTIGNIQCIKDLKKIYGASNVIGIYLTASESCRKCRAIFRVGWENFDENEWERREKDDLTAFANRFVDSHCKFIINTEGATPTQLYAKFKHIYYLLKGGVKVN